MCFMSKKNFYIDLFTTMFMISLSTFGGGFVIISLMQKKFVEERKWIDKEEILDLTAIAQSAPGSLAVNAAFLFGYQLRKLKGALVATIATILPSFIIIVFISLFYSFFSDNIVVQTGLKVMRSGVAAVIIDVALKLSQDVVKSKDVYNIAFMVFAFVMSFIIGVSTISLIILGLIMASAIEFKNVRKSVA